MEKYILTIILSIHAITLHGMDTNEPQQKLNAKLIHACHHACHEEDSEQIKALLEAKADVNCFHQRNFTALMIAAQKGNLPMCELLICAKADVNLKYETDWFPFIYDHHSALMLAARKGHHRICELLIQAKADIFYKYCGKSALLLAGNFGHLSICELLIEKRLSTPRPWLARNITIFLGCLRKTRQPNYHNLKNAFKNTFYAFIRKENMDNTHRKINEIENERIKQSLLKQYSH